MLTGTGVNLHSTEIRVENGELLVQMTRMREWLDSRRFQPAAFRYQHVDGVVVIHVDFEAEEEAAAFARRFQGKLLR
jgi:hypothetical protein